jgi:ubiquinone/menaquinone biosynthesis C-methylase UbiE
MTEIQAKYDAFYKARDAAHVYPVEFVVRAFLGSYPRLKADPKLYPGRKVLDLGFGDGRNMPLLCDLGMEVHGVEIAEEICRRGVARLAALGYAIEARVGRNHQIPYGDAFFDHIVACHACYYVDPDTTFSDNVKEIARVMKPGGRFVFSAPIGKSYILNGATPLRDGHMRIANDPYGVRNGYVMRKFDSEAEIEAAIAPFFVDVRVGTARNDWWGIDEQVWIVVCTRA